MALEAAVRFWWLIELYPNHFRRRARTVGRKPVDEFHHFIIVVIDDFCSLGSHHLLSIALALADRRQDSRFCRAGVADSTVLENAFDELFDLDLQRFVRDGLFEECEEFLVRALEAAQQLVPDKFSGYLIV